MKSPEGILGRFRDKPDAETRRAEWLAKVRSHPGGIEGYPSDLFSANHAYHESAFASDHRPRRGLTTLCPKTTSPSRAPLPGGAVRLRSRYEIRDGRPVSFDFGAVPAPASAPAARLAGPAP